MYVILLFNLYLQEFTLAITYIKLLFLYVNPIYYVNNALSLLSTEE
jgi:hypothetical protein